MIHPWKRRQQGGVLVVASALMLVIVLLGALLYGISWRIQQRQSLDAAMRESTRTVAQQWTYQGFASDQPITIAEGSITTRAKLILEANLADVPGLVKSPHTIAKTAHWRIVRPGERCGAEPAPAAGLCGHVVVAVRSFPLGFRGTTSLTITALTMLETTDP